MPKGITYTNSQKKLNELVNFINSINSTDDWREYEDTNGEYFVSNKGDIISIYNNKPILIKQFKCNEYYYVRIHGKNKRVNRIVAETWIPNEDNKPLVHHISHDKSDNSVNNLAWATYKENTAEYIKYKKEQEKKAE